MLFNATEKEESRVAILKDGKLDGYFIERSSLGSLLGNIYHGRVINIEPSIDSAFVDFGGTRHGFLHASDVQRGIKEEVPEKETKPRKASSDSGSRRESKKPRRRTKDQPIGDLLTSGQNVVVQVTKDGINDKAPTMTTYISLPGRYVVFMPGTTKRGISRKIEDEGERDRLKKLLTELKTPTNMGLIVRTAGAGQTKQALQKDVRYLNNLWKVIQKRIRSQPVPASLYQENDLTIRTLRDLYSSDIKEVLVDSEEVCKRMKEFMQIIMPRNVERVKLYKGSRPLFDHYSIEKELESIMERRIPLKSGGSLVMEQTEALVAIDVNSGKFKAGELEETAFKINQEAATEIARQLRLRDLGGLIICDFIDMRQDKHKRGVEKVFREALKEDRARIKLARMSPFGIIELTRQRMKQSLKRSVYEECTHCQGTGYVPLPETACLNIIRKIRLWITQRGKSLTVYANPKIADYMNNHKRILILDLEKKSGKSISIISSPALRRGEIEMLETREVQKRQAPSKGIHPIT
jgi:ribonuclease E